MKRDEYLADEHVRGFTRWAGQLVTGELGLTHRWKSRGMTKARTGERRANRGAHTAFSEVESCLNSTNFRW